MKCPYRTEIRECQDGLTKVRKTEFMDCIGSDCPYWGAIAISADDYEWIYGCRKAKKECS